MLAQNALQVREEPERATTTGNKFATTNTDISTALDPLDGSCATLARGYWSYKWCHRKSVTQVHRYKADNYDLLLWVLRGFVMSMAAPPMQPC